MLYSSKPRLISTYYLLQANKLDLYCQGFATKVNQTICVPSQCTTYTWQAADTCDNVALLLSTGH